MIEKQNINGRDVWLRVDPYRVERDNPNIIPTEYFTASYYTEEPAGDHLRGVTLEEEEEGRPKLFESPVAALSYALRKLKSLI